jgi:hypothetical protein
VEPAKRFIGFPPFTSFKAAPPAFSLLQSNRCATAPETMEHRGSKAMRALDPPCAHVPR